MKIRINVINLDEVRRRMIEQIHLDVGLAVRCDRCAGVIYPDLAHVCPDVIDLQALDPDLPALPDRTDP